MENHFRVLDHHQSSAGLSFSRYLFRKGKRKNCRASATAVADSPTQRLGIVFNLNKKNYPYFTLDVVTGEPNDANDAFAGTVEKMDISRYVNTDQLPEADREMLGVLRKLQESEINKYISRNSPFSGIWENIIHHEDDDLPDETKELMAEYLLPKLKKMFTESAGGPFVFVLPEKKAFKTNNLVPLHCNQPKQTIYCQEECTIHDSMPGKSRRYRI
jgi:hypothetical protein